MHLSLPPKAEPSPDRDSRYSSIASTPVSTSRDPSVNKPALVQSTLKVSKNRKAKNIQHSAVPTQSVANAPSQSRNGEVGALLSESTTLSAP